VSVVFLSIVMEITKSIGNLYLAIDWYHEFSSTLAIERLVGSILMLLTMLIFMVVLFYPCLPWYQKRINKN
jgi:hypothetical protein